MPTTIQTTILLSGYPLGYVDVSLRVLSATRPAKDAVSFQWRVRFRQSAQRQPIPKPFEYYLLFLRRSRCAYRTKTNIAHPFHPLLNRVAATRQPPARRLLPPRSAVQLASASLLRTHTTSLRYATGSGRSPTTFADMVARTISCGRSSETQWTHFRTLAVKLPTRAASRRCSTTKPRSQPSSLHSVESFPDCSRWKFP